MARRIAWVVGTVLAVLLSGRHFLGLAALGFFVGFSQWLVLRNTLWFIAATGFGWLAGVGAAVMIDTPASGALVGLATGVAQGWILGRYRIPIVAWTVGGAIALPLLVYADLIVGAAVVLGLATVVIVRPGRLPQHWIPIGLGFSAAAYLAFDSARVRAEPATLPQPVKDPELLVVARASEQDGLIESLGERTVMLVASSNAHKTVPWIVFLHGSGAQSVYGFVKRKFGPAVRQRPLAVLALEKFGVKPTEGRSPNGTREYLERDYKQQRVFDVVAAIREGGSVAGDVHLIGYSEGCDVAAAVAREVKPKSVVLLAGGGFSQGEEMRLTLQTLMHTGGELIDRFNARLVDRYMWAKSRLVRADPTPDKQFLGLSHLRWASYIDEAPLDDLRGVRCPILVIYGRNDQSVPVESARALGNLPNVTYKEYEDLDHDFRNRSGADQIQDVIDYALDWILR